MERVVIYGACERGKLIKEIIEKKVLNEIEIVYFIDIDKQKINKKFYGIEIISLEELSGKVHEQLIDKIIIATNEIYHQEVAKKLRRAKFKNILVLNNESFKLCECENEQYEIEQLFEPIKPILEYLEFHVIDDCNLNCKGCGHFANLAPKNSFSDINKFERDIERLRELFCNISTIRILGGEPLLNKELDKFIIITRNAFPHSDLHLVTNGVLIPQMSDGLISVIKENNVIIDISWYEPTIKMKEKIVEMFHKNEINYDLSNMIVVDKFCKQLTLSNGNNKHDSAKECVSRSCHFLENGFISKCGLPFLIKYLANNFKLKEFDEEIIKKSIIDIYDKKIKGFDIIDFLDDPIDFCKYCSKSREFYGWETKNGSEVKLEDWIIC